MGYEQLCWYSWDGCGVFSWTLLRGFHWLAMIPFLTLSIFPGVFYDYMRKRMDPDLGDVLYEAQHEGYITAEFNMPVLKTDDSRAGGKAPSPSHREERVECFRALQDIIKEYETHTVKNR